MPRLFVAIRPPEEVVDALFDTMEAVESARWQSDEQLHLTLRFIGEVDRHLGEDLANSLAAIGFAPFPVVIAGVGHFERKRRAHALWARVEPSAPLLELQRRVEAACRRAGLAPETRKYLLHITLARLRGASGDIASWLVDHARMRPQIFEVTSFSLFESQLTRNGPVYREIARFPTA